MSKTLFKECKLLLIKKHTLVFYYGYEMSSENIILKSDILLSITDSAIAIEWQEYLYFQ